MGEKHLRASIESCMKNVSRSIVIWDKLEICCKTWVGCSVQTAQIN